MGSTDELQKKGFIAEDSKALQKLKGRLWVNESTSGVRGFEDPVFRLCLEADETPDHLLMKWVACELPQICVFRTHWIYPEYPIMWSCKENCPL